MQASAGNAALVEMGVLEQDGATGEKRPSELGRYLGVSLRSGKNSAGQPFRMPVYDQTAQAIVANVLRAKKG